MLRRKIETQLEAWRSAPKCTVLLVIGAYQIGKTCIIGHFAQQHYDHTVEFNFIKNPNLAALFDRSRDTKNLLMRLELTVSTPLVPGKTLIFFDEVQRCKEMVTAIRSLVDDGQLDYALSGSLPGVELEDIRSVPVGYLAELDIYPLDSQEFCWPQHIGNDVFDILAECLAKHQEVDEFIRQGLVELYSKYLVTGGMPAAVDSFVANGSVANVRTIQENIKREYRRDISQYACKEDWLHIRAIYDLVPSELSGPNKRFTFVEIEKNMRFQSVASDFDWLVNADVTVVAHNVDEPYTPLEMSKERNLFKFLYDDVGLLTGLLLKKTALDVPDGSPDTNYGSIYENAVTQEPRAYGFDLYRYNSKKLGELDSLVWDRNDHVPPIEVKSGKSYERHRTMGNVLAHPEYHFSTGYVLGSCNTLVEGNATHLPVYIVGMSHNEWRAVHLVNKYMSVRWFRLIKGPAPIS